MPPKRTDIPEATVLSMYAANVHEFRIAKHFSCSRDVINRILRENGIRRRSIKESYAIRLAAGEAPALGCKRPDASERMKKHNPTHMKGIPEKRAVTIAATYRADPFPAEARFEYALNHLGLERGKDYEFQLPIGPYIADFVFPALGLIIEIDGRGHRSRLKAQARRDEYLATLGYHTIRIPADLRTGYGLCGETKGKAIKALREVTGQDVVSSPDLFGPKPTARR